jgi:hypothetical protein
MHILQYLHFNHSLIFYYYFNNCGSHKTKSKICFLQIKPNKICAAACMPHTLGKKSTLNKTNLVYEGPYTGLSGAHQIVRWVVPNRPVLRSPVHFLLFISCSVLLLWIDFIKSLALRQI